MNDIDTYNSRYGICTYLCKDGVWYEIKNCCCGHEGDNDWYLCDELKLPDCDISVNNLTISTSCYPK